MVGLDPVNSHGCEWSDTTMAVSDAGAGRVSVRREPAQVLVELVGDFDEASVAPVRELGARLDFASVGVIAIDGSRVTFASSALLGSLLTLQRRVRSSGGQLRLSASSPILDRVLQLTQLDGAFRGDAAHECPERDGQ
jgi:anti-anti-sigma factor